MDQTIVADVQVHHSEFAGCVCESITGFLFPVAVPVPAAVVVAGQPEIMAGVLLDRTSLVPAIPVSDEVPVIRLERPAVGYHLLKRLRGDVPETVVLVEAVAGNLVGTGPQCGLHIRTAKGVHRHLLFLVVWVPLPFVPHTIYKTPRLDEVGG